MGYPETFTGYAVTDINNWSTTSLYEFKPKPFGDFDIDVEIEACGICGSDVHTVTGGWAKPTLPVIPGHEIIGTVVAVGKKVTTLKVGDRAGVGAQIYSCSCDQLAEDKKEEIKCPVCKTDDEVYCPELVDTYNSRYPDGTMAYGGYSSHVRAHEYFTFKIPDSLPTEATAPMLCAGITTYSPLVRNGAGPGKKVGIVGIGGLGHFGIMWARALGAEVYVFSRTDKKKEDAMKLGADHFIATEKEGWNKDLLFQLDVIVSTANSSTNFNLGDYLSTLKVGAKFISVGLPEEPFSVGAGSFIGNASCLSSSHLGNRQEMIDMLNLAAEKKLGSWYEPLQVGPAGIKEGLERCHDNDIRYRFTLTGYDKAFK